MYKHSKLPKPINAPINIETILRKHKTKVASLQHMTYSKQIKDKTI